MISAELKSLILSKICENSQEGIFILDENLKYVWVNESFSMIIGYPEEMVLNKPLTIEEYNLLNSSEQAMARQVTKALATDGYFHDNLTLLTRYDVDIDANVTIWRIEDVNCRFYVGQLRDISVATATQRTLAHLMNYDQVTGLPNRNFFMSKLSEYIIDTYQELAVVRLSIDRYQAITHAFSVKEAHSLLSQFIKRINRLELPNLEVFAHFGDNDFALLFETPHADDIRPSLDLVMQQFELPFAVGDEQIYLHISVGISAYPVHGNQMDQLTRYGERAMNLVQHNGGDDIIWYHQGIGGDSLLDIQLESQLRQALAQNEFVPHYQPKFNLTTHKICGFEALVRWQHPTRGLLGPMHFLPTIIESRLSYELFCTMTVMVAKQLQQWAAKGLHTQMCVNTDAAEFRHPDFLTFIHQTLEQYSIKPGSFHIEMTESSLMVNDEHSIATVKALKEAGILVALDDFGTGYASLSYLHHYPFDFVKIDKSFIDNITTDARHKNIVKAIITMAHNLSMKVVAEGIEDADQAHLLQELGSEYGQGYYFGRPVASDIATAMLVDDANNK